MTERMEKKLEQIKKIEKRVAKWQNACTEKEIELAKQFKHNYVGWIHYAKENNIGGTGGNVVELRRALEDLDTANEQLIKIQKAEEKKADKEATLNDMPEPMKEFADRVYKAWNEQDKQMREYFRDEYKKLDYHEFWKKYRSYGYNLMHTTDEEIEKENKKAIDNLILNLLNRVIEKTGKITDTKYLKVTSGNNGYAVINGIILGEKGRAVVESIGAGGYNIQKYHIRTLVK